MGDEDHRLPKPVQLLEDGQDLQPRLRVQVSGGLVCQNQLGIVHQCPGDGHSLLLAATQLAGKVLGPILQPDHLQSLCTEARNVGAGGVDERKFDVLQGRGLRKKMEGLEDEPDLLVPETGQFVGAVFIDT